MNKNNIISIIALITLLFSGVNSVFSQEWEAVYYNDDIELQRYYYDEAIELSNGYVLVASGYYIRNNIANMCAGHPALALISSDGEELCRKEYMKPGLCEITRPYLFEKNGDMYMLTSYSPDHDIYSTNYFKNYDNPPTDAILGLYKLDEYLNVTKSYEHVYPIDTFEWRYSTWNILPHFDCGNVYVYTAFEEDGSITGSYIKSVSFSNVPRGSDSIFFFKMDFEGKFLLHKGYEMGTSDGSGTQLRYRRQQMVKTNDGYVMYTKGWEMDKHGTVEFYDNNFNHIKTRYVVMPGHNPYFDSNITDATVIRSNENTTYVATRSPSLKDNYGSDVRLYEFNDDFNGTSDVLPVVKYIDRGSKDQDCLPYRSLDMTSEGYIYFAYTLDYFGDSGSSWVIIELLDKDFNKISELYYDDGEDVSVEVKSIKTAKDDGLIIVTAHKENSQSKWSKVTKFPASAFGIDNIEEAHANNLHLAVAYPNPGGDVMNIRTGLRNAVLSVYDIQGRKIHEQEITDDVTSVDASNWQSGTYVWKLGMWNEELGIKEVESGKWVK